MFRKFFISLFVAVMPLNLLAQEWDSAPYDVGFQTVYTETPVQSYLAYPNDPNFIPEDHFMQRSDSIDFDRNIDAARMQEEMQNPGVIFSERPVVVCRDFGCTKLNDRITRTFLFNSLANSFMLNQHSRVSICEADPFNRSCLQSGISFPVRAGAANALVKIPKGTVSQVNISRGLSKATVGMTYEFLVNGIDRRCEPTVMDIVVPTNSQATLVNREFACNMTSDGMTNVSLMWNIDYIDLDYGIVGGYYSLGLQGPTSGGGTGYALMKLEFTNRGLRFSAADGTALGNSGIGSGLQTIQPGEYAVEPMR